MAGLAPKGEVKKPSISQIQFQGAPGNHSCTFDTMDLFLSKLLVIYYNLERIWLYKNFYRRGTSLATKCTPCPHQCNPNGPITY